MESDTEETQTRKPSLKLNVLSNGVALAVNIVIGFFLIPAIAAHLGEKRFGMWMLVSSIVGYFGLMRLGMGSAVIRYVPMYRGKGQFDKVSSIVSTGMAFYLAIAALIVGISLLFADFISGFFGGGKEFAQLITLIGLAAALECPGRIFDSAARGYEGFVYVNIISVVNAIVRALALITCIIFGWGLAAMGCAFVLVSAVGLGLEWLTFRIYCKGAHIRFKSVNLVDLKILFYFGAAEVVAGVADVLTYSTPKMIVGKVMSLEAVGLFGVAALLVSYYRQAVYTLTKVFMPRFSYLSGLEADESIRKLFFKGARVSAIVAGILATGIWTVGPGFVRLWMGKDFALSVPTLMILTGGAFVLLSHRMSTDLLYGLGRQNFVARIYSIESIAVFGLSLLLSFRYGLIGVALGISVPMIVVRSIFQAKYVCKMINVSVRHYYTRCILRPWAASIALAVIASVLGVNGYINSWVSFLLVSAMVTLVYGTVTYLAVIESSDKKQINSWLLGILRLAPANH